jgi:hypothetical protein
MSQKYHNFQTDRNQTFYMKIDDNTNMIIKQEFNDWAALYFTDEKDNFIENPTDIVIYGMDISNHYCKIKNSLPETVYWLSWKIQEYAIHHKDQIVLSIKTISPHTWHYTYPKPIPLE